MNPRFVSTPLNSLMCWALCERFMGQLAGPAYVPCSKHRRSGFLTCKAHQKWEHAARAHRDHHAKKETA